MPQVRSASSVRASQGSASPALEYRWRTTVSHMVCVHEPLWSSSKTRHSYAVQGPAPYGHTKETDSLEQAAKLLAKAGTDHGTLIALEEFLHDDGRTYSVRQCEWNADSETWGEWR